MAELHEFLNRIVVELVNPLLLLLSAGAFVVFLWGILDFIRNAADAKKREEGRSAIMWGFVGLVIIFGAFGIINVALESAGCSGPVGSWGLVSCPGS
jgi:Type IV secretion system pilin